jgi:SAM-dependent methyltransferase
MDLAILGHNWNLLAQQDPMWAILMVPGRRNGRWDKREFFQTGRDDILYVLTRVRDLRFPLRRGRALDFGCGVGRLTQALACYFDETVGVDIAPAMIEQARFHNPYPSRCHFRLNACDDLRQFPDNQFDLIVSIIVLQHIRHDYARRYIAEFLRVLAPGGLLVFQQPSHYSRKAFAPDYEPRLLRVRRKAQVQYRKVIGRLAHKLSGRRGQPPFDFSAITRPRFERIEPPLDCRPGHGGIDPAAPSGRQQANAALDRANAIDPEVYCLVVFERRELLKYLKQLGGRVVDVEQRGESHPHIASYRYFVTK